MFSCGSSRPAGVAIFLNNCLIWRLFFSCCCGKYEKSLFIWIIFVAITTSGLTKWYLIIINNYYRYHWTSHSWPREYITAHILKRAFCAICKLVVEMTLVWTRSSHLSDLNDKNNRIIIAISDLLSRMNQK